MTPPLRLLFAGTPDFAASHLAQLVGSQHSVVAVLTQPDRPSGRGKKVKATPVKQCALDAGLTVLQPATLKSKEVQATIAAYGADAMIVVAYGLILPQAVLDLPRYGCINVHGSLLPRWRGAAPIQRAIEAGDTETGITIMQMEAGLDTGPMLATATTPISEDDTTIELYSRLAAMGPKLLTGVLDDLPAHLSSATVQNDDLATYASKISKAEGHISWQQPARTIARRIHAFLPAPGCYSELLGHRVKFWRATALSATPTATPGTIVAIDNKTFDIACGDGLLRVEQAQLPGGKPLAVTDLLNARSDIFHAGVVFGDNR
ncbi:methionyl-tRNA formyltransferase [Luminiphilus syltensis NOR5-1B]|uniref:Methionyl-tRNA formyltransferase n=1 Tax=Luminiphilus syltensis NOR5-1B TaxID=565045 RepID=B8KUG0_9GAMM|nr:methionyl-tRNA formyltransferase [Luminiphilus syltensis]EED35240.1 methionyl-tRNA formyltransferase [Luminiphilus syltensis NOR5-1B]